MDDLLSFASATMLVQPAILCLLTRVRASLLLLLLAIVVPTDSSLPQTGDVERVEANSSSSSSFLVWQFCHFSRGRALDWTVSTTGLLVTSPLYLQPTVNRQLSYHSVVSISGMRTQTTVNGSSSQLLTGIVPWGGFQSNDNVLMSGGAAVLSPTGLSYQLDRAVAVPGSLVAQSRINLYMFQSPPIENDQDKASIGLAYFVFSPGNTDTGLPCPPPVAQTFTFLYHSAPSSYAHGLFSSCSTGTFSVLGPYSYLDHSTGAQYATYITQNASGVHLFSNLTTSQLLSITGVSAQGGADFTLFSSYPYTDVNGITVTLSADSLAPGQEGISWLHLSSPDHAATVETGLYGGDNRMDFHVAPLDGAEPAAVCSAGVSVLKWDFCFIATGVDGGGRWAVVMNGTLLSTPSINSSVPSYYATAAIGQRVQVNSSGAVTVTAITGVQSYNGDAATPNDNRLYVYHPTLSTAGLTLTFDSDQPPVKLPLSNAQPVWFTTLAGSPPMEKYVAQGGVDYSSFVYQPSTDQADITQPASLACGLPIQYQQQLMQQQHPSPPSASTLKARVEPLPSSSLQTLYFYYSAVPDGAVAEEFGTTWSVCTEGSFSALGPYTYGTDEVYQVISVSGTRLFLDQFGVSSSSDLIGVALLNGANQLLYVRAPGVDPQGLTLTMTPAPLFPNVDNNVVSSFVTLSNGSGETTSFDVPDSQLLFFFSAQRDAVPSCVQPGDALQSSQDGVIVVLAATIGLLGYALAMMTVELMYAAFRRRQLVAMVAWLGVTAGAMGWSTWAAIATYYASIDVQCSDCLSPLTVGYRLDVLFLAWLPSLLCMTGSLLVMTASLKEDETHRMQQQMLYPERTSSTLGRSSTLGGSIILAHGSIALSPALDCTTEAESGSVVHRWLEREWTKTKKTCGRLYGAATLHLLPSGALMAAALILTRYSLSTLLVTQADVRSLTVVDVLVSLLVMALCCLALLWLFFAQYYRLVGPVLLSGALLLDCELHFVSNAVSYHPHLPILSHEPLSVATLLLIAGLTGFGHLLAMVSTAIHRARTAKRLMAARIRKTTSKLNSAQTVIHAQQSTIERLTLFGLEAVKAVDCITALRPMQVDPSRGQTDQQRKAMTEALLCSTLCNSSSGALLDSALHRSAQLVAPLLVVAGTSGRHSSLASRTQAGAPVERRDSTVQNAMGRRDTSSRASAALPSPDTKAAWSSATERAPSVSAVAASTVVEMLHGSLAGMHRVSSAEELNTPAAAPASSTAPEASLTSARDGRTGRNVDGQLLTEEQSLLVSLRTLLKAPGVSEAKGEARLLRQLSDLPSGLSEAAMVQKLLLSAAQDRTKEGSAALASITASACAYQPTLQHVLSHPVSTELLKDHLQQAASVENILFLLRLAQWKAVDNPALKRVMAMSLLNDFVRDGSSGQVNLPATQRDQLILAITTGRTLAPDVFARAEAEVVGLVLANNWSSFTRTAAYGLCRGVLVRNAVVMTALQLREGSTLTPQSNGGDELDMLHAEASGGGVSSRSDDEAAGGEASIVRAEAEPNQRALTATAPQQRSTMEVV